MAFQLGASLLDACVLSVLNTGDSYGYQLTQSLKEVVTISDSTLYPVLRRLKTENALETYDKAFEGRNRRYYQITKSGKDLYTQYLLEWDDYKQKVDKIMTGGISHE